MNVSKRDARRRDRMLAYVRRKFGQDVTEPRSEARRALQTKLSVTKGRMTQLFDRDQPFGEKAAAEVARTLNLDSDYFERDHEEDELGVKARGDSADVERKQEQLARLTYLWEPLFEPQRERLLQMIQRENAIAREAIDEMKRRGWINPNVPEDVLPPQFTRPAQRELSVDDESTARQRPKEPKK